MVTKYIVIILWGLIISYIGHTILYIDLILSNLVVANYVCGDDKSYHGDNF